jgi:hypothetical protein
MEKKRVAEYVKIRHNTDEGFKERRKYCRNKMMEVYQQRKQQQQE